MILVLVDPKNRGFLCREGYESVGFFCILWYKAAKEVDLTLEDLQLVSSLWCREIKDSLNFEGVNRYPFVGYDQPK